MTKDQVALATLIRERLEDAFEVMVDRERDQAVKGRGSADRPAGLISTAGVRAGCKSATLWHKTDSSPQQS